MLPKASNIIEFKQIMSPDPVTAEQTDYYVNFYEREIKKMRNKIVDAPKRFDSIYLAGQVGTGKTSALYHLPNEEVKQIFNVIHINYRDLLDLDDVDITDIFLMFCYKLIENSTNMQDKFFSLLEQYRNVMLGRTIISGESEKAAVDTKGIGKEFSVGFDLYKLVQAKMKFFSDYKISQTSKKIIREIFTVNDSALIDLSNEIITDYYSEYGSEKRLLVIFDDLEKIKNHEHIKKIFIDNIQKFHKIECKKLLSVPVVLTAHTLFKGDENSVPVVFNLKIRQNPFNTEPELEQKRKIDQNLMLLTELISRRCQNADYSFIDDDAMVLAIDKSGGIIRQYVNILIEAVANARYNGGSKISKNDVEEAVNERRAYMSRQILGKEKIALLAEIQQKHLTGEVDAKLLIESVLSNEVIVYQNHDTWYDVNPLIEETVKIYSTPLKTKNEHGNANT